MRGFVRNEAKTMRNMMHRGLRWLGVGVTAIVLMASTARSESNVFIHLPAQLEVDAGYDLALKELKTVLAAKGYQATTRFLGKGDSLPDGNRIIAGEVGKPGFTWTPLKKADDPTIHHDRIDYVYFKGEGLKVTDAKVIGESKENADILVTPYPYDHRAMVATITFAKQTKSGKLEKQEADK